MYPTFLSGDEARLRRLHHWLTLEGSSVVLGSFVFFLPFGLVYTVLKWGAILFTPYMVWTLVQCRQYGWVAGFAVVVGIPAVFGFFAETTTVGGFILSMLPLFMFYVYTWVLRHRVGEWMEELRWKRQNEILQMKSHH